MGPLLITLGKVLAVMITQLLVDQQQEETEVCSLKLLCPEAYPEKKLANTEEDWHQETLLIKI